MHSVVRRMFGITRFFRLIVMDNSRSRESSIKNGKDA